MKVNGIGPLSKFLNEVASLEGVKQAVKSNTATLQQKAQRYAPVAPVHGGTLKRSITIEMRDNGYTGAVGSYVEYSIYQELGTRKMKAQPYLRPALKETEIKFKKDLKKALK